MKRKAVIWLCVLLAMAGCAPSFDNDEEIIEENQDDTSQETAIIPSYNVTEEEYKVILPYKVSKARGVIVGQIANRLDIGELEEGLRRHSKQSFDPDKFYFQEGQKIDEDTVLTWIDELNPEDEEDWDEKVYRNNPRYLSHILEQDYLQKTGENTVELGGMSIGIALKSNYRFQTEPGGPYYYEDISEKEMLREGKKIAQQILERVRGMEDMPDVPIMIALYREEGRNALVPGEFVAKTSVSANSSSIGDWESIDEENVLFPSDDAKENYSEESDRMKTFEQDVAEYFPNYTGVIGKGFYIDDELKKLRIEIPIEFQGKAEVVGFTQYVYGLAMETFENYYDLEINIKSNQRQESLITRDAGEDEPEVHIYQ
ncbi:CamS family sex pheromone protein [Sediminibacillus dalangtanensis]|uniref:CamS family sex pheromone protein n=1 Tax=Sediminibacillus dalangtanensis TaxID=2729421 RepID=A0ABX7VQI4_9BACI|nr:CamS family sex pheromone protein [Sediminibacillus dalangtanensis]QTM98229.1 CamS family sex pheromone protein [Sediminibacillus dalangtanensis]